MKTTKLLMVIAILFVLPCASHAQRYSVFFTSKDKICQKSNGTKVKAQFQKKMARIALVNIPIKGDLLIVDTKENVTYRTTTPIKEKIYAIIADKEGAKISQKKFKTLASKYVNMPSSTKMQTAGVGYRGIYEDNFVMDSIFDTPILIE